MALLLFLLAAQESAVERYLAEKDRSARSRILAEIKGPLARVEAELRVPPPRPAAKGGPVRKRLKADHPLGVEFEYHLWVPRDYDPARRWRLLISLHGQSGNGEGQGAKWLRDVEGAGDLFLLCPSAGRGGWGRSLLGHAYILNSLRDVLRSYAIDPDLVFLDGASMGGNGSFEFVCTYPDLFAAAAPRSGGPAFRYAKDKSLTAERLDGLLATPVYWVIGAKDHEVQNEWVHVAKKQLEALGVQLTFREYPQGGHEWFPQENPRVLEWLAGRRRDPYPPRVGLATNERLFNRNFWLEVADFKEKEIIKRGFLDLDRKPIEERLILPDWVVVHAEILKETNEIRVTASGARELRLYFHEKMLDLAKPVLVTVNGTKSKVEPRPSMEALLESARRDRGLLYTASAKVRVP